MRYGVQIASFLFLMTIIFNYFRHKRLPLKSTHYFTAFILISAFNMVSEGFTLLTINNIDTIPAWINRFAHQCFIGSVNLIIVMLYFYIDLKCRSQKKYKPYELIIRLTPLFIGLLFVLFGDLKYHIGSDGRYSYGVMAYTIYIGVVIYLIAVIIELIAFRHKFSKSELVAIGLGILSWSVVSLVQFFEPTWLMSSLAVVLMVNFLYMSFENTEKYLVAKDGCVFSKNAFDLTVNEYIVKESRFYVINYVLSNYDTISHEIGLDETYAVLNEFASEMSKKIKGTVFLVNDSTISLIVEDFDEYMKLFDKCSEVIPYKYKNLTLKLKILKKGVVGLDCHSYDEVIDTLERVDDSLVCNKDNKVYNVLIKDIYYIEVIDNQSFIYTKKECFESKEKLYQLEEKLSQWDFVRCSKSLLCNIQKIVSTAKEPNSRLAVYLNNEESIIVSRQYVKEFKLRTKL